MARYFADQAERLMEAHIEAAYYNMDAAIVFGRSVLHRLRAGYNSKPKTYGYKKWEKDQCKNSWSALVKHFTEQRNFILKEGSIGKRRLFSVILTTEAQISVRPIRTILESVRGHLRHFYESAIGQFELEAPQKPEASTVSSVFEPLPSAPSAAQISVDMYFDDPDYGRAPALVVLRQYFTELETIIFAAEKKFGI